MTTSATGFASGYPSVRPQAAEEVAVPLFEPGGADPAQPMVDWINSAPPADLAVELFAVFGPEAANPRPWLAASEFTDWMFRGYPARTGWVVPARPVEEPILEAIQLLEHSELVYLRMISLEFCRWSPTRLGRTLLVDGKVAVRQRIKERTGL